MRAGLAVVLIGPFLAGCLPQGHAPIGQRVLPARGKAGAQFVPPPAEGGPGRLLAWLAREDGEGDDLYVIDLPPGEDPAPPRQIAERVAVSSSIICDPLTVPGHPQCRVVVNSGGAVLLRDWAPPPPDALLRDVPGPPLALVELDTGQRVNPGMVTIAQASPSGDRLLVGLGGLGGQEPLRVLDLAGSRVVRETVLPPLSQQVMVGEDLFYSPRLEGSQPSLSPRPLLVLRASGASLEIAADVASFSTRRIAGTEQLLLQRSVTAATSDSAFALLDPATLTEIPLSPALNQGACCSFSPDGRWAVLTGTTTRGAVSFFDRESGALTTHSLPSEGRGGSFFSEPILWRPGREEAWIPTGETGILIWRPGAELQAIERQPWPYQRRPEGEESLFTPDGQHWFSAEPDFTSAVVPVFLGLTDDPEGPRQLLTPAGTTSSVHWPLPGADGRLVVETWTTDQKRADIYLVDPAAGTAHALATGGNTIAVGAKRILTLAHWLPVGGSGDLTEVQLETGQPTLMAENVSFIAVEESAPAADPLAAGTRLVFVVHNRLSSPFDGLWVATLP
jgi:hypothetical protein